MAGAAASRNCYNKNKQSSHIIVCVSIIVRNKQIQNILNVTLCHNVESLIKLAPKPSQNVRVW